MSKKKDNKPKWNSIEQRKAIVSINEYYLLKLEFYKNAVLEKFRNIYLREYNIGEKEIPWKKYKISEQFNIDFKKFEEDYPILVSLEDEKTIEDETFISEYKKYVEETKINLERIKREKREAEERKKLEKEEIRKYLTDTFMIGKNKETYLKKIQNALDKGFYTYFTTHQIQLLDRNSSNYKIYDGIEYSYTHYLSIKNMELFCDEYDNYVKEMSLKSYYNTISIWKNALKYVNSRKFIKEHYASIEKYNSFNILKEFISQEADNILKPIIEKYTLNYVIQLMNDFNPNYDGKLNKYLNYKETKEIIKNGILNKIPENYIDLFPLARRMHRKFVIHIGGTNSGKTYTAIQALKKAVTGIYLGPLRLLAFEQYERLNQDGYPCNLVTGEEKKEVENAHYQASTIEMLDMTKIYDVAVIDEAQLISDKFRGGAWTNAILGVRASEVHICAAPEAEEVLKKIIESCGDEYIVEHHKRNTPLIYQDTPFNFTNKQNGIEKGDALIVFSKRRVHAVAQDLKKLKITSSIIYGALPYDVRQNEAKKFADGITDVVVTTDAIGLGMNLPIKRVVFLETKKFDGEEVRELKTQEIKQIAGRAGRYGIFDEGYVNSYENTSLIVGSLYADVPTIKVAYLRFPESLVWINGPLSSILSQWDKMKANKGFKKADISHEKKLCGIAEELTDDKQLIYDFITIPFEDENVELLRLWTKLLKAKIANEHIALHTVSSITEDNVKYMDLSSLEEAYKVCDLLYYYNEKFEESIESQYVLEEKMLISNQIMYLLDKKQIPANKCKCCGKPLKWNFKYNICESCHWDNIYNNYYY